MTTTATAAVLREPGGEFTFETVQLDDLRADEVLVRIQAAGVCHTDAMAQHLTPLPAVFGHEGAGIVEEVGQDVEDFAPGDRVMTSWPSCGTCPCCASGETYICDHGDSMFFAGCRLDQSRTMTLDGKQISGAFFQQSSFATRSIVLARALVKTEEDLAPELLAALTCGIMTGAGAILNSLDVQPLDSLVVIGTGAVGLSAVMAARIAGASPIIAVDINSSRLALARELGATHVLNATEEEDVASAIREIVSRGVRFVFDTTGRDSSWNVGAKSIAMGGTVATVAAPPVSTTDFEPLTLLVKGARLQFILGGSSRPQVLLPRLIEWHKAGLFPFDRLVKTFDFAQINEAFRESAAGTAIKPVLRIS